MVLCCEAPSATEEKGAHETKYMPSFYRCWLRRRPTATAANPIRARTAAIAKDVGSPVLAVVARETDVVCTLGADDEECDAVVAVVGVAVVVVVIDGVCVLLETLGVLSLCLLVSVLVVVFLYIFVTTSSAAVLSPESSAS